MPPTLEPGTCGLAEPAFCEKFDSPSPGGRGGDLDERIWSFARWGHELQYLWVRRPAAAHPEHLFPATFCGETFSGILPGEDVRTCDGPSVDGSTSRQLHEVFDDQGDFGLNSMRVRQPFDFTGRTGTIVWDVDAKVNPLNLGHGWWFEIWISEDPAPMPYHDAPTVGAHPRRGVGFAFQFGADCPEDYLGDWWNALETVHVLHDYEFVHDLPFWVLEQTDDRCFKVKDTRLNHFELRISRESAELWATDWDDPTSLKLRVRVPHLDLTFSRGYVHLQHGHYNGVKDGLEACGSGGGDPAACPTPVQTFRWDNIGFDGPTYPTPRGHDVQDNDEPGGDGVLIGWYIDDGMPHAFTIHEVDPSDALSASFNFNLMAELGSTLEYRFNGNTWHTFELPPDRGFGGLQSYSAPVPLTDLAAGENTVEVHAPNPTQAESIGNMDLTLEVPR